MPTKTKWQRTVAAFLLTGILAGCGPAAETPPAGDPEPGPGAGSSAPDPTGGGNSALPALDAAKAQKIATATNAMGFDLLGQLAAGSDANTIISPLSIANLLGMLLTGAAGETAAGIGQVLHLDDPTAPGAAADYAALLHSLTRAGSGIELAAANSLWPQQGFPVRADYLAQVEEIFDATVQEVDLGDAATAAAIDEWVKEHTRDRIDGMAEQLGVPSPDLVLVLLNAVYFQGNWTDPFDPEHTRPGTFTRPDGSEVEVPMMSRRGMYAQATGDGFQVIRLPYGPNKRFGMEIFLPAAGHSIADLLDMDAEAWAAARAQLTEADVMLTMPRFELEYQATDLDTVLQDLGMDSAYGPGADFSPMSDANPMLSTIQHKTYIRVDEKGTEAAAVTGGAMVTSMPPEVRVDRPFVFTISDTETGAILFMGAVTNPAE